MAAIQCEQCGVQVAGVTRQQLVGDDKKACIGMLFSMMKLQRARNRDAFPGSNPVSIERATLPKLSHTAYMASAKTDGVRMLLMAVTLRKQRLCLVVDRSMRMFVLPGHLPTMSFEGSLLDGEVVRFSTDGSWRFLIFDCVYLSGLDLASQPFSRRLDFARSWLEDIGPGLDGMTVSVKRFAAVGHEQLPVEPGMPDDGLIFVPEHQAYTPFRNDGLLKWKANQLHTVDFKVEKGKLMVLSKSRLVEKGSLHPSDEASEGAVVECRLDGEQWRVVKVREDKTAPNDQFVLGKTVLNIQENIQRDELGV